MYELSKQKKIDTISTMIVIIDILSNQELFFAIEYICLADQLTHTQQTSNGGLPRHHRCGRTGEVRSGGGGLKDG